ncbi:conserved hypothetical protein [Thermosulfidibacter takaii ABI70S6]|uniref:DUF218 domain-containing protein n=1 Tax=Thermosulfidibacter takaii (strain DSM 17441 / JCM 13301 / NBRC 103674 / ABI70S6) TaxID=1298851 RepID=A0A0S3QW56_THET7|nr:ElyC/SanA/YdcF family protein [Thermosulfidibacter takaii]BAT72559.1 conserved hypothetical protein [Thermosulfidibacter takaii ABI70S6]
MFLVRKIIDYTLRPLPLLVLFMLFMSLKRRNKALLALTLLLYAIGITPVADLLIKPLERQYSRPSVVNSNIKYVVVLTGDFYTRKTPISSSGCSSTKRLLEAVSLCRKLKHCTLILSGGKLFTEKAGSAIWARILDELGDFQYIVETKSKTTKENAFLVKSIVGKKPFYLVTSAYHMPRSLLTFKRAGTNPIPYPADYLAESSYSIIDFFPLGRNIRKVELALHEYIALLYYFFL